SIDHYWDVFDQQTGKLVFRYKGDGHMFPHFSIIGLIPGTRHLIIMDVNTSELLIYDIDTSQLLRTLRFPPEAPPRAQSLFSNDDHRITNKGIWTVNTRMHQNPGGMALDGSWVPPSEKTIDGQLSPHMEFFEFPTDNSDIITTIHSRPMKATIGPSRLRVLPDGSVCVFSILRASDDIEVTVVHPRSTVYTKSKPKAPQN